MAKNIEMGDWVYHYEKDAVVTIRSTTEFYVFLEGELIGPDSVNDRKFVVDRLPAGADLVVRSWTEPFIDYKYIPPRNEPGGGEKMVEIIPSEELSMFDRLRAEVLQAMSVYAEQRGFESYEEANDLEFDDDDDSLIFTPYEAKEMAEEYLKETPDVSADAPAESAGSVAAEGGDASANGEVSNPESDRRNIEDVEAE